MSQRSRRGKRRQLTRHHHHGEEETVDDLAYASGFAMMGPPTTTSPVEPTTNESREPDMEDASNPDGDDGMDGDEDIDIESESDSDDDDDDDDSEGSGDDEKDENEEEDDDDEDEDDHEDLVKAIAAMEDDVIEEEDPGTLSNKASHKTQHEVDAYNTPIHELEQHLQFRLTVDNNDNGNTNNQATKSSRQVQASDLKCAGTIKHHMAEEYTVVIESNPPIRGASLNPLDEGTLLLMKGEESSSSSTNSSNTFNNLIPLGRIFETFGPVTRPLYTIRLPELIDPPKPASRVEKKAPQDNNHTTSPETESPSNGNNNETSSNNTMNDDSDLTTDNKNQKSEHGPKDGKEQKKKNDGTASARQVDNWGPKGKYTQLIKSKFGSGGVVVYFVEDEAKLIDTDLLLRTSGKGCDASNVYDEEVLNKDEVYYSDDEKERQAKSRRKGARNQKSGQQSHRQSHQQSHQQRESSRHAIPKGFHQNTTAPGFHAAPPVSRAPMPQGFHQPPPPMYGHPHAAPYQQQPYPNYGYPGPVPPPPPPAANQSRRANGAPPNTSGPPPAYHY
ncbi:MAG: hypothetical protein SGBAC_001164 [Bacillariaceae sp.]